MSKKCWLILLSLLWLFRIFVPYVDATLSGTDFVTEITTAPSGVDLVDVDSAGRIFVIASGDIYRSVDAGVTWIKVFDGTETSTSLPGILHIDKRDYIFAPIKNSSYVDLYRSTDHGNNWTKVVNNFGSFMWKIDSDSQTNVYLNGYGGTKDIWRSNDSGATWSQVYYNSSVSHFHGVAVAPNDWVFGFSGDGATTPIVVSKDYGQTWEIWAIGNTSQSSQEISAIFDMIICTQSQMGALKFSRFLILEHGVNTELYCFRQTLKLAQVQLGYMMEPDILTALC